VYVPRPFTYEQLVEATSNFDKKKELGHGAFGTVYKGRLPGIDMAVAIKEIKETSTDQAKKAFKTEIRIMSKLHHRNVLRLLGWCEEDQHLLLIYEIMENGNLEDRLYPIPRPGNADNTTVCGVTENVTYSSSQLGWVARYVLYAQHLICL
jgi:serine/threonine protein kinase